MFKTVSAVVRWHSKKDGRREGGGTVGNGPRDWVAEEFSIKLHTVSAYFYVLLLRGV